MVNIKTLAAELSNDPLGVGYVAMTDEQALHSITAKTRQKNKSEIAGAEIIEMVDLSEYDMLSAQKKQLFWDLVHAGTVDPFGNAYTLMNDAFGPSSATMAKFNSGKIKLISRADELGLRGRLRVGYIAAARGAE